MLVFVTVWHRRKCLNTRPDLVHRFIDIQEFGKQKTNRMQLKLLSCLLLCSVLRANAVINQRGNEANSKPDFNNVFSSLFGFKSTFLGAKRNLVNKQLDRVSSGLNGIGNMFGVQGPSQSGDSHGSGHSSGGHDGGYNYEPPAVPVVQSSYGPPAPQQSYRPATNIYLPPAPIQSYGPPSQHIDDGYHYEKPAAANSASGFASSVSHDPHRSSSSSSKGFSGLQDLTSIGSLGGSSKGKGKGSKGQSNGLGGIGGLGNIFSSIG